MPYYELIRFDMTLLPGARAAANIHSRVAVLAMDGRLS